MSIAVSEDDGLAISSVALAQAGNVKVLQDCLFRSPPAAHLNTRRGASADGNQSSQDINPSLALGGQVRKFGENDKLRAFRSEIPPTLAKTPKIISGERLDPKSSAEVPNAVLP